MIANIVTIWFCLLLAYLLGSIPMGLLLGKLAGMGDIRKIGSGNIGATNMMRTGNKWLALATLLLDAFKGVVAVLLCDALMVRFLGMAHATGYLFAVMAVAGHVWSVWLKFKGGKGVATTLGVFFAINPPLGAFCVVVWLIVFYFTRYSSLSAIISIAISPIMAFAAVGPEAAVMALVLAFIVIGKHKDNIRRLRDGSETKWSKKA